jgi:hypothetical protein
MLAGLVPLIAGWLLVLAPARAATYDSGSEAAFVSATNQARSQNGLGSVAVAADLVSVARQHAADMAAQNRLYDDPNLGSEVQDWQAVGENSGEGPSEAAIEQAFMQSPSHRANILGAYSQIGVGAVWSGSTLWVAEVFRQPQSGAAPSGSAGAAGSGPSDSAPVAEPRQSPRPVAMPTTTPAPRPVVTTAAKPPVASAAAGPAPLAVSVPTTVAPPTRSVASVPVLPTAPVAAPTAAAWAPPSYAPVQETSYAGATSVPGVLRPSHPSRLVLTGLSLLTVVLLAGDLLGLGRAWRRGRG